MILFPYGTLTPFARAVSAEVRSAMAARRLSVREVAHQAGFKSHNYLAIRLRDERPLTLDDVELICEYLGEEAVDFVRRAHRLHDERYWVEASALARLNPSAVRAARRVIEAHAVRARAEAEGDVDDDHGDGSGQIGTA